MLQFEPSWRFTSPGEAPTALVRAFYGFIEKVANQRETWTVVERFKAHFNGGYGRSSSLSWAWSDLDTAMSSAAENAPLFIEAFYNACEECAAEGYAIPERALINRALSDCNAGYELRPPYLLAAGSHPPIAVPQKLPSLSEQFHVLFQDAINASDEFLRKGQGRRAVSELLWLLETVTTAFRGTGSDESTVQGKYFVPIVKEMKAHGRGKAQEQILTWMTTLHGYLSSPTGGGVRHGTDINEGSPMQPHEARLYCNLIRSYITFMIEEHERLTVAGVV